MRPAIIVSTIIALLSFVIYLSRPTSQNRESSQTLASPTASALQENVTYQAAFLIYTNGTKRDFTSSRYHDLDSSAHIKADKPSIIQVKSSGITWQYFFDTLPMQLSADCLVTGTNQRFCTGTERSLKFYLNGAEDQQALSRVIMPGDQLLVTYGSESEVEIAKQLLQITIPTN